LREICLMRCVRVLIVVLATSVCSVAGFCATKVELREFTCPVDGTKFSGRALVETDKFGGVDSDFCAWPGGTSGMAYEVQVCPKCFYATRNDYFNQRLPGDIKKSLKTALAKWRADHPEVTKVEELTPGQRWELTALCGIVKHNHPPLMGNLWLRAAWAARHHACHTLRMNFGDPMSTFEIVDGMEADLKAEKNENKAIVLTFRLVMACHRAGDPKRRDVFVKALEGKKLKEKDAARLAALKEAFAREALYQQRALDAFNKALDEDKIKPDERDVYLFIVADTTRRLGKDEEAVTRYKKVKEAGKIRADIRKMCDFMIHWLAPE